MKKILIPCEFTDASQSALEFGAGLANLYRADVRLLHVNAVPLSNPEFGVTAYAFENSEESCVDALKNMAGKIAFQYQHINSVDFQVETGQPVATIKDVCKTYQPDVVVAGASWYGNNVAQTLLGSTSLDLARECDTDVMIIPQGIPFEPPTTVAYACDYEKFNSGRTLQKARSYATEMGAELIVLHVVPRGHELDSSEMEVDNYIERKLEGSRYRTVIMRDDKVTDGISAFVNNYHPQILMLEPSQHSFIYRLFHNSTTSQVIFNNSIPVLALH